ncbi:MAG: CHAD domain-containing protein [Hyphomicrobiales bacterium]|nr:CHAD domain-containing protein [Hyphomicrobiales bacterium]MBV8440651.1 CHAD domain-containing protein [Hyphomicrobiales bacterium]
MGKPRRHEAETELKLNISPAGEMRIAELAVFRPPQASEPESQRIVTTYFDTPNSDLKRHGFSLRVRRAGDKRIQAVKAAGGSGVAKERGEWEWPTEKESPDLALAAGTPLADVLPPDAEKELGPVVVTDIVRTTRTVKAEGTTIEAALDNGSIEAGETEQPVHELELELREGTPAALYRLALALLAATPLTVEVESKAERGYRLMDKSGPRPEKPKALELGRKVRCIEGLREIIANGLGHLLANRASAMERDAEGIHQTRVATRRLRSALKMLEPRLEPHATALFQDELRRIGRVIGEARDWDVFCLETLPKSFAEPKDAELGEVMRQAAEARRAAADERCGRELAASSFTALVLGLAAWAETGRELRRAVGDRRLKRRLSRQSPDLLDRLARRVTKRARALAPNAPASELHPVRKALKKLRYGVEFVAAFYPRKEVKRYLRQLKGLQESLGAINDAAVAIQLAEDVAKANRVELGAPVAVIAAASEHASRTAKRKLDRQWDAFREQGPFWR